MERTRWIKADLPADFRLDYEVSDRGDIRSIDHTANLIIHGHPVTRFCAGRVLRQQSNRGGYAIVSLQTGDGSKKRTLALAPLVCRSFNGPPETPGLHCGHLNGIRSDNRPENLAWVTPTENEAHKELHGTRMRGEAHHQAILTEPQVRRIRKRWQGGRAINALARDYGMSDVQIGDIVRRKSWRHVV